MRKILLMILPAALCLAGCEGDILQLTDDPIAVSDDGEPDGTLAETDFTGEVSIVWSGSGAEVTGSDDQFSTVVNGAEVTITYTGEDKIIYNLSGSSSDGSFKLYSDARQAIKLDGLSLTSTSGAAINIQSGHLTYVEVSGHNSLNDSASATYSTESSEDCKAVLFSEGSLLFSGDGVLAISALNSQGKSAIASDDHITVSETPVISIQAVAGAGHGIKANDYVQISGGYLDILTKANMKKGITSDGYVLIEGGETAINVSGGVARDDDGEYTGSAGIKADNFFGMTGGELTIHNTGNGGKGIRAGSYNYDEKNHTLADSYIKGGEITIITTGGEVNDVSAKGIKIGYKESSTKPGWGGGSYVYAGNMVVSGGRINVSCQQSEGFEVKGNLTFDGGETYVYSAGDDAINSQGELTVNDGFVFGYSTGNDGIDANGNINLNGGYTFGITTRGAPEVGIDANTEGGYKLYINSGATVVAYGGLESGYSATQSVYTFSGTAGAWNALWDGDKFIAAFKGPSNISSYAVSAPGLSTTAYAGVTVAGGSERCFGTWAVDGISGGSETTLTTYSGGGGFGPGGGGPRW